MILVVVLFFSHFLRALPSGAGRDCPRRRGRIVPGVGAPELVAIEPLRVVVAMAAILGVMSSGLLRGVMIGASSRSCNCCVARPDRTLPSFGRIPGTRAFLTANVIRIMN